MKIKDALIIGAIAGTTMAVTLAVLLPARVDAGAQAAAVKPLIARPKLVAAGCTFTLKTDKQAYKPGEAPRVTIRAANPTDKPVRKDIFVSMSGISAASRMSRMPVMPRSLWRHKCPVSLKPGETKTICLDTGTKLPAGTIITIAMTGNNRPVVGARFPVALKLSKARPQVIARQGK